MGRTLGAIAADLAALAKELAALAQAAAADTPIEPAPQPVTEAEAAPAAEAEAKKGRKKFNSFPELREATGLPKLPPPPAVGQTIPKPYRETLSLYAQSLINEGLQFWQMGMIGHALLTYKETQIVTATPDVASRIGDLSQPVPVANLPKKIWETMETWYKLCQELGYQPTGWAEGAARRLIEKRGNNTEPLVMGLFSFQPPDGEDEAPFGLTLQVKGDVVRVLAVANPQGLPGAPSVDDEIKLAELCEPGTTYAHKLVRTWIKLENLFSSLYHRDGTPRAREDRQRDER